MQIPTPSCVRDFNDFSEKQPTADPNCFPAVSCPAVPPISKDSCAPRPSSCPAGDVCASAAWCGSPFAWDSNMGCGGTLCPEAARLWDTTNMQMHRGMAINFTGSADVDFVRGMIAHHIGALDMCRVLIHNLTCVEQDNMGGLDGLVHFCNHVELEQEREVGGMRAWLTLRGLSEHAMCSMQGSMPGHSGHGGHEAHRRAATMHEGCGNLTSASTVAFVRANMDMHQGMAVDVSCDHSVDFSRMMLPHHEGAVVMCNVLLTHMPTADPYLEELCMNISYTQRAEITWLSQWLNARGKATVAPCGCPHPQQPPIPCNDILPASSFCHGLNGDTLCRCNSTIAQYGCAQDVPLMGFGVLNVTNECMRSCGQCTGRPSTTQELTFNACPDALEANNDSSASHRRVRATPFLTLLLTLLTLASIFAVGTTHSGSDGVYGLAITVGMPVSLNALVLKEASLSVTGH